MKVTTLSLALFSGLFLVACGGSSGGGSKNTITASSSSSSAISSSFGSSSSTQSSIPVTYSLGGSVSGQVDGGSLTLHAASQTLTINSNGTFSFPNEIQENSPITLSLIDVSPRQHCNIDSTPQFTLQSDLSNIAISCTPVGVLTGTVSNYYTGTPIGQARITVTALNDAGETLINASVLTNETGAYRIAGLGIAERFVLNAWSEGFATRSEIFSNSTEQPDVSHSALVLQAHYSEGFSASSVASLIVDGQTLVNLPANAFVTADGTPASGTITPALTIIDPSGDAGVMPGNYEVLNPETGEINLMESFGALDASFRDAEGNLLQLAPGTSATISIPMASRITPATAPATVPLFYFDEHNGYWIEEGEATLTQEDGQYFYRGTVTHFTTWNADRIYETVNLRGCVQDTAGNSLANARVVATGRNYIGHSVGYSNSEGDFVVPVRISSEILVTSISGSQSDTVITTSGVTDKTIETCLQLAESSATITLTWGENPRDLDSHWFIPRVEGDSEYRVYFGNKTQEVNGVVFDLDVDDTWSFGPEVVTVPDFPHAGIYRYVVHLYTGTGTIASSPARVELNLRGRIYVFSPTEASGDNTEEFWHVFNIQVDDEGNASVMPVQEFTDSRSAPQEPVVNRSSAHVQKANNTKTTNKEKPAAKERKYYAE
jgi:uncharacterized protein YfaP (DUF2135 family)